VDITHKSGDKPTIVIIVIVVIATLLLVGIISVFIWWRRRIKAGSLSNLYTVILVEKRQTRKIMF